MTNVLNRYLCVGQGTANTGNPDCEPIPGNFVGAILVPSGTVFTQTQVLTLDTVLQALAKDDSAAARVYPITRFQEMTDESTEPKTFESGYGDTTQLSMGKPQWSFGLHKGMYSWANIVEFDNQQNQWDVLFIDEESNALWGKSVNNGFGGFPLNRLSVGLPKLNDASTPFSHMITFGLKTAKDLQRFAVVQFSDDTDVVTMVSGLLTVQPSVATAFASGVGDIRLMAAGTDMYDLYSTELTSTTEWLVSVNGAAFANPSAVTAGTATNTWELTTGATAGQTISIKLEAPSVLEAAGVAGYESATIETTTT